MNKVVIKKAPDLIKKIIYVTLSVLIAFTLFVLFKPKATIVEKYTVKKSTFLETMTADGKVRSQEKQTVVAFFEGNTTGVNLKVGDQIRKSDLITVIKSNPDRAVKSPLTGVVSKVYQESSRPILRGEPIIDIIDPKNLEIVSEVLTTDVVKLKEGGRVRISGWGDDKVIDGTIFRVSKAGFTKISALGVEEERTEVRVSFSDLPEELLSKLGDNFHVNLNFIISENENVLSVPLGALYKVNESWAVFVIDSKKRARQRKIFISKQNEHEALVTSGLSEGDTVILFPGDKIQEGVLVQ